MNKVKIVQQIINITNPYSGKIISSSELNSNGNGNGNYEILQEVINNFFPMVPKSNDTQVNECETKKSKSSK